MVFVILQNLRPCSLCCTDTKYIKGIFGNTFTGSRDVDPAGHNDAAFLSKTFRDTDGTGQCIDRNGDADDIRSIRIVNVADVFVFQFHVMVLPDQIYDRQQPQRRCHMQL